MAILTGRSYADTIATYITHNFGGRGLQVFREVPLGKTIIGKDRQVDILVVHQLSNRALAIECKYQDQRGTTDEKIPYALADLAAMRVPGCLIYAGEGWSPGIRHMLEGSHLAAYAFPAPGSQPTSTTRELDHILAMTFQFWDIVLRGRSPFVPTDPPLPTP
jgi:hypothetical protein